MSTTPTQVDRTLVRPRRTLTFLLVTVLSSGALFGDRVELKTGEVFFGKILRANQREVSMSLGSGGIVSFRMNQVAYFRKNVVVSDEWNTHPVLEVDDPTLDIITEPESDTSFQASPTPAEGEEPRAEIVIGPPTDLDPSLIRPPVEGRGFRVSPPRGFLDWEAPGSSLLRRFYDPVTHADLDVVDLGTADESLESVKSKTAAAHARNTPTALPFLRDEKVRGSGYEGWYSEFQDDPDGEGIRRVWLFARAGRRTLLLKYSCPEERYEELRRPFAESIRSFSPVEIEAVEASADGGGAEPKVTESPSVHEDPASELLRLLRSNQDPDKSRKAFDEYLKRGESGNR